jgi:hypothetical protein
MATASTLLFSDGGSLILRSVHWVRINGSYWAQVLAANRSAVAAALQIDIAVILNLPRGNIIIDSMRIGSLIVTYEVFRNASQAIPDSTINLVIAAGSFEALQELYTSVTEVLQTPLTNETIHVNGTLTILSSDTRGDPATGACGTTCIAAVAAGVGVVVLIAVVSGVVVVHRRRRRAQQTAKGRRSNILPPLDHGEDGGAGAVRSSETLDEVIDSPATVGRVTSAASVRRGEYEPSASKHKLPDVFVFPPLYRSSSKLPPPTEQTATTPLHFKSSGSGRSVLGTSTRIGPPTAAAPHPPSTTLNRAHTIVSFRDDELVVDRDTYRGESSSGRRLFESPSRKPLTPPPSRGHATAPTDASHHYDKWDDVEDDMYHLLHPLPPDEADGPHWPFGDAEEHATEEEQIAFLAMDDVDRTLQEAARTELLGAPPRRPPPADEDGSDDEFDKSSTLTSDWEWEYDEEFYEEADGEKSTDIIGDGNADESINTNNDTGPPLTSRLTGASLNADSAPLVFEHHDAEKDNTTASGHAAENENNDDVAPAPAPAFRVPSAPKSRRRPADCS